MFYKIAHRGASGYVTENTLESIQKAIDLKADAIELDVHVCASREVVVFHDFTLDRLTNVNGAISNFTLKELDNIKIQNQYKIPTLSEVLDLVDRRCWLNIELKGKNSAKPVFDVLKHYILNKGWKNENFLISSFQYTELETFSNFNSKIPIAILTQASIEQALEWAIKFNAKAIHPHFSLLTKESCEKAINLGFQINTWTVNNVEDIEHLKRFPLNGIISDFPDKL